MGRDTPGATAGQVEVEIAAWAGAVGRSRTRLEAAMADQLPSSGDVVSVRVRASDNCRLLDATVAAAGACAALRTGRIRLADLGRHTSTTRSTPA